MVIKDRNQFAEYFNNIKSGLGNDDSPLWIPDEGKENISNWFVCVRPIKAHKFKYDYYNWCNLTLQGNVRCYSSDENEEEWWGFTNYDDIFIWILKWS